MDPPGVVDDSFRNLFDKVAGIIHEQEDFEKAHETLDKHFRYLRKWNSRAVYEVPSKVAESDERLVVKFALPVVGEDRQPTLHISPV